MVLLKFCWCAQNILYRIFQWLEISILVMWSFSKVFFMWFIALYIKDAKFAFWATQRVFWPKVKKADPQFWGSLLSSLCLKNASELRFLHVKVEPKTPFHCPRVDQKKIFSLKFGFNLPNFTTLGGCLLKNWTYVQKLVS